MQSSDLKQYGRVVFELEAGLICPALRIQDLLALRRGSVILTGRAAGENVVVTAGKKQFGIGALGRAGQRVTVRMLDFIGEAPDDGPV